MNNKDRITVWYENSPVGKLWQDAWGKIGFEYEQSWLETGFAISQQMPLSQQLYPASDPKPQTFFGNLLPEAALRQEIVRQLKIADDDFALLNAIGGECAGALCLLPDGMLPEPHNVYEIISPEQFNQLLIQKGYFNLGLNDNQRPRLSLAGVQQKIPIFYDKQNYYLSINTAPSSHIIKFETSNYKHVIAYEYYLTCLAKFIGLPVVECELKNFNNRSFLLIKRYDRIIVNGSIKRLHQEDFCQALGYFHGKKYQIDNGPSFADCYRLIQKISTDPLTDSANLLKWQIFNVLAGNSDGHAKNIAIIYDSNQNTRLAPFYDLVCTRAIARIDHKLAFSVGNTFIPGEIKISDLQKMAYEIDVTYNYLIKIIKDLCENILTHINLTSELFKSNQGQYPALQRVEQVIHKQCQKMLKLFL